MSEGVENTLTEEDGYAQARDEEEVKRSQSLPQQRPTESSHENER